MRAGAERNAFNFGVAHDVGRIDQSNHNAGQNTGGEQKNSRLFRRNGIEDHRDRRRDHNRNGARRGDQADGKTLVVATRFQRRIDHPSHRDHRADRSVGHRAEQL